MWQLRQRTWQRLSLDKLSRERSSLQLHDNTVAVLRLTRWQETAPFSFYGPCAHYPFPVLLICKGAREELPPPAGQQAILKRIRSRPGPDPATSTRIRARSAAAVAAVASCYLRWLALQPRPGIAGVLWSAVMRAQELTWQTVHAETWEAAVSRSDKPLRPPPQLHPSGRYIIECT